MPYVTRDAAGRIVAVSVNATGTASEEIGAGAPELTSFLAQLAPEATGDLADTDLGLIRVVEDLIDTLIDKDLIRFTDLPEAAQRKLVLRRSLRRSMNVLNLLGDEGQTGPEIKL